MFLTSFITASRRSAIVEHLQCRPRPRASCARDFLDDLVARIGDRVDRMAEADDHFLVRDARADVLLGLVRRVVALLDLERDFVGAAVLRAAQRADRAGDRRVHVGARAGDHARGERRRVELVLGVEDERRVHRMHPLARRAAPDAAGAGSGRRSNRPRSRPRCACRRGCSDTSTPASSRGSRSAGRRCRARRRRCDRPSPAARSRAPKRRCASRPSDGWPPAAARAPPCTAAGNAAQPRQLRLVGRELGVIRQLAVDQQVRDLLELAARRRRRGCRSRGSADRCRCARPCTAPCCRRSRRTARRTSSA